MKITVFELEDWERQHFESLAQDHDVKLLPKPLTPDNADEYADAEAISTFIYSKFTDEVIKQLTNLKLIATRSTGFDHIPLDVCRERTGTVCNVPTYGKNTVAEHVLLTISHKLDLAIDRTRKGDFSPKGLQGFDLYGKTMGVIGTGDIGRETIRIAKGFGMEVLAFDIEPDQEAAAQLGFEYLDMNVVLNRSDVISLHVPANEKTRGLISHEQFAHMKDGAVLINTSRARW